MTKGTYQDGLDDGQQVGIFMAYRIVKAEKKLHAHNSGAGRVLKSIEEKLKKQASDEGSEAPTNDGTPDPAKATPPTQSLSNELRQAIDCCPADQKCKLCDGRIKHLEEIVQSATTQARYKDCGYCGEPVEQPIIVTLKLYCNHSHRQLAYIERKESATLKATLKGHKR